MNTGVGRNIFVGVYVYVYVCSHLCSSTTNQ